MAHPRTIWRRGLLGAAVAALVAAAALWPIGDGPREAEAVGDLPNESTYVPNVMLFYDSSASQNGSMGTANVENNTLGGYRGPVKRYMSFQKVLTGLLSDGRKRYGDASGGLLDLHIDELRFGFVGVDNSKNEATTSSGDFSYGPDVSGTLWTFDKASSRIVADGTGSGNQGIHNRSASAFPLVPLFNDQDKAQDNRTIQEAVMSTAFSANQSGLMDAFRDLAWYWENDFPRDSSGLDCGSDRYNIYLMGGPPNPKELSNAVDWVKDLKDRLGVRTYVVALGKSSEPDLAVTLSYANLIAQAGGGVCASSPEVYGPSYGHCAYVALGGDCSGKDPNCDLAGTKDLASKLGTVLSIILAQVTSRTRLAAAGAPLLSADDGTTFQVSAYFQSMIRGGPWRGFLRGTRFLNGEVAQTIAFDQILQARDWTTRRILTRDAAGAVRPLRDVVDAELGTFVTEQRATFSTRPCVASAFFDSTTEWSRMLYGGPADNLSSPDCQADPDDQALVKGWQDHRLGDIYHSSPLVVGPPSAFVSDPAYLRYLVANKDRPTMVYVGANDGMLHAFYLAHPTDQSKVGQEAWAYVPRALLPRLPARITQHEFFVDGNVVVKDVQLPRRGRDSEEWRTVLLMGLGRGGPLYLAIDVTDPDDPRLLWELTDPLLSRTLGTPAVGRVFVDEVETPVAFLSGGYDPSATGEVGRSFYVVNLITGELLKRFSNADAESVQPALDAQLSGGATAYEDQPATMATRAFIGDVKGRMWRIDVSSSDRSRWRMTRFYPAVGSPHDDVAYQKPIFLAPSIALDPSRRPIVYYGTGNLDQLDAVEPNYFYAVREEIVPSTITETPPSYRGVLADPKGFPIVLAEKEKLAGEAVIFNGVLLFTTFTSSDDVCGFGEGRLYGLDYLSGRPRLTNRGAITYAGTEGAVAWISLGGGVPTAPVVRPGPTKVAFDAGGRAVVTGGNYFAHVQSGAAVRTDEVHDTTVSVDLGPVLQRADILSVIELE